MRSAMNGRPSSSTLPKRCGTAWTTKALLFDKRSGLFADPGLVHRIDHAGRHFTCVVR